MNNAVWGHPIMYGNYNAKDEIWKGKCTLNPLGAIHNEYYGLTMLYKPGSIVKLDTRGFNSEREKMSRNYTVTIAPDYKEQLTDPKSIAYVSYLYNSYKVEN